MKSSKQQIFSLFIAFIMVFSIFGFILGSGPEKKIYGEFKFTRTPNGWLTYINGEKTLFQYLPDEAQITDSVKKIIQDTKTLAITYDTNSTDAQLLAQMQFYAEELLKSQDKVYIIHALANATNFEAQEANCDTSASAMPVLLIESSNETNIFNKDYCIIVQFQSIPDAIKLIEGIVYTVLEIG